MSRLVLIWGGLILVYLLVANRSGTAAAFTGVTNLFTSSTKALQGR